MSSDILQTVFVNSLAVLTNTDADNVASRTEPFFLILSSIRLFQPAKNFRLGQNGYFLMEKPSCAADVLCKYL